MKEVADFTEQFDRCLVNEPAFCTAMCPFGLDVRAFTKKIRQDQLTAAYKQYRDAVVFPGIVSRLCPRPCEELCPLGSIDRPIDIQGLERRVNEAAGNTKPDFFNLPPRGKCIGVIGAGLSGLACAIKLAQKKYNVTIFEAASEIGGDITAEIGLQFQNEKYALVMERRIDSQDEALELGFDAIYIATGEGGNAFGLKIPAASACIDSPAIPGCLPSMIVPCSETNHIGERPSANTEGSRRGLSDLAAGAGVCLVAGGALVGSMGVYAIADGAIAAEAIDAFLRTGILKADRPSRGTKMVLAPIHLELYKEKSGKYTGSENEAARCLGCRCDACMVYCDLPSYIGKPPLRIRDEVFATTLPGKSEVKATPAKRLINMDNLSGVFSEVCPVHIDMDALLIAGRQSMHRQEKMPWAFHEFWLRDMEHANNEAALLLRHCEDANSDGKNGFPEKKDPMPLAFFPGCQIGASSPNIVRAVWSELLSLNETHAISLSGLVLRCCGAPADWAGDEELFDNTLKSLREDWESLGRPALACVCPGCMRVLSDCLQEIETISIYEILPPLFNGNTHTEDCPEWAVFDPCAAARLPDGKSVALGNSVRKMAMAMGIDTVPLAIQEHLPRCCGFGGQPELASPDFVRIVSGKRAAESSLPYLCYCMNCRESFMKVDKKSAHILELRYAKLLPSTPELSPSARRRNREQLRGSLQGGCRAPGCDATAPAISYTEGLLEQMDADKILTDDVQTILGHISLSGERVLHRDTGIYSGSAMIGKTTYWVDYMENSDKAGGLTVTAAYSHRLAIEREPVWAGIHSGIPADGWFCGLDNVALVEADAYFSYLGRSFRHRILRCPVCGLPYVSENLARNRMHEVEMSLEDK